MHSYEDTKIRFHFSHFRILGIYLFTTTHLSSSIHAFHLSLLNSFQHPWTFSLSKFIQYHPLQSRNVKRASKNLPTSAKLAKVNPIHHFFSNYTFIFLGLVPHSMHPRSMVQKHNLIRLEKGNCDGFLHRDGQK